MRRAEAFFNAGEDYNFLGNNCHQFAAHAMNLMAYDGKRNWNMVHLATMMLLRGKWVDGWWSRIKCYGVFVVTMTTSIVMGWWGVVTGVLGTFIALVLYFALYSFVLTSPAKKVYATPLIKKHHHQHDREMQDVSSAVSVE